MFVSSLLMLQLPLATSYSTPCNIPRKHAYALYIYYLEKNEDFHLKKKKKKKKKNWTHDKENGYPVHRPFSTEVYIMLYNEINVHYINMYVKNEYVILSGNNFTVEFGLLPMNSFT